MQRKQMEKHADKTRTAQILNCQQFYPSKQTVRDLDSLAVWMVIHSKNVHVRVEKTETHIGWNIAFLPFTPSIILLLIPFVSTDLGSICWKQADSVISDNSKKKKKKLMWFLISGIPYTQQNITIISSKMCKLNYETGNSF